ncbi:MAG: ATP-binding protein [Betaproteobacteria bacterium]
MMRTVQAGSVRTRVMWVVLSTTFASLLLAGTTLLLYELRNYKSNRVAEVQSVANIISRASAPAISFEDAKAAKENLALLAVRPKINAAAIYKPGGTLFATYSRLPEAASFPRLPPADGYSIVGDRVLHFQRIVENNEVLGTLYIDATYEPLERLKDYLLILGVVMVAAMSLAFAISAWLQGAITQPILDITRVSRDVINRRDFSLRARKTTEDEIGELAEAFNGMLSEVGQRSSELEIINLSLEHEMSEKREAVEALRDADRRKDEFLATLAHELRNPLAPLRNGLEILRMPGVDATMSARARDMMERQLRQMVRLVDDLLDVSRITTGKLVVTRERTVLQSIVQSAVETARPFVETRKHLLTIDLPATPIHVQADSTRLSQVLSNLINNAARYTEPGGTIGVSVALHSDSVSIYVSDNGIGIAPALQRSIFDMFTQVDQSLERRQAGLGVGLTLAKKLVELHDGVIDVSSDGLGQGTTMIVTLPLARLEAALPAPAAPAQEVEPARQPDGKRILLADDNIDFVNSMGTLLEAMGHEVLVAHDGAQALAAAPAFKPDFAFLDIGMPMMNGYDLARHLRALPETAKTVITAVSGWGQVSDRRRAAEAGFNHHLVKPVEIEQLENIIAGTVS